MNNALLVKLLFALSTLLFSMPTFSQVSLAWEKFYGNSSKQNDQVRAMVADGSGNVIVTGISAGINNKPDYVTIKYNASGVEQWVVRCDGFSGNDEAQAIAIDKSGNIYVTGYSENNASSYDFATVAYNSAGVQLWVARFNGPANGLDWAFAVKLDKDNNIYVSGFATVSGSTSDCAVVKYNSSGVLIWARYYDGSGHDSDLAFAMAVDSVTSDVFVTGNTTSAGYNQDYITIRYNSAGDELWARTYNGTGNTFDDGREIVLDAQGNVYVSGLSRSPENVYDCATIKYNKSGSLEWVSRYSGPGNIICQPNAIVADKVGNIYITGFTLNEQFRYLCSTLKYSSEGILQWAQLYSGIPGGDNIGWAIASDTQNNIYVAGQGSGGGTSIDYITLKYNPEGMQKWVQRYDVSNLINTANSIAVNKFNDVLVAGSVRTDADNIADYYDYATIKYTQAQPLVIKATPDTTLYYGYGSNCVQLNAEVSGGVAPYSFSWSPGGTVMNEQSISVCPTASTVYTVTVRDVNGTTATATVSVKVIDIRCGNQLQKVLVCHKGKELCIPATAVPEHLQHGDIRGGCNENHHPIAEYLTGESITASGVLRKDFVNASITSSPNPLNNSSTISYEIPSDAYVIIQLFRQTGEEIKTLVQQHKSAGKHTVLMDASNLNSGVYYVRMIVASKNAQSLHVQKINVVR